MTEPDRICVVCGRRIQWRKRWSRDWHAIRYCSDRCRHHKLTCTDLALEAGWLDALSRTTAGATVQLGEIVNAAGATHAPEPVRAAARRLVAQGVAEIVQGGRVVDPSTATGPFGLRQSGAHP